MRHTASRTLYAHWDALRGDRQAPDRAEIEPRSLATVLADTFVLEADATGMAPYRLAGSKICALFGHEMTGLSFLAHFQGDDRETVDRALKDGGENAAIITIAARGITEGGREVALEMIILPLVHRGTLGARFIGALAPFGDTFWRGRDAIVELTLEHVRLSWPDQLAAAKAQAMEELLGRAAMKDMAKPNTTSANAPTARPKVSLRVVEGGKA
jgi:hypothetical protein